MKRLIFGGLAVFLTTFTFAQVEEELDSLQQSALTEEIPFAQDSAEMFMLPSNYEYIPSDDTPELIEDRLSCIQKTIPLTYNEKVHSFINFFAVKDREYTKMMIRRKDMYFPLFEQSMKEYGLPDELKYLSIIESGLFPKAVSRARAVGLWQFMSGTGRYFNLYNDWYMDDRMDPEKSTQAACRYLSQLYSLFGDWQLALAAYNSGPGTVRKAIRKSGYKKTFWEVYPHLPRETRAYVPQFIAIIYVMNYAEQHNFLIEGEKEELVAHDTVRVNKFMHFETFAKLTGTCLEDMQKLNPHVLRNAIPETGKTYTVKVPLEAKMRLAENRVAILDSASKVGKKELELLAVTSSGSTYGREMTVYRVKAGDALGSIAQRHRVRLDDIKKWNNLKSNTIHPGQRLNLWVMPSMSAAMNKPSAATVKAVSLSPDSKTYTVQPGDTLWDISKKFEGLSIDKIRSLNKLKGNKLQPGQKLIIG
jgi:membrane-bound lytic murein transglycosylase D